MMGMILSRIVGVLTHTNQIQKIEETNWSVTEQKLDSTAHDAPIS